MCVGVGVCVSSHLVCAPVFTLGMKHVRAPAGVEQKEANKGVFFFFLHPPSAVLDFIAFRLFSRVLVVIFTCLTAVVT